MVVNPYIDNKISHECFIRTFNISEIDEMDLVWHCDEFDREVLVLEGEGWLFQRDNELPFEINKGDSLFIRRNEYHRIHKGKTDLKIEITEYGR